MGSGDAIFSLSSPRKKGKYEVFESGQEDLFEAS